MSRATYPLKLPLSIKAAAARLARQDGVSLNQWIASAVAQKVGAVETAATFLSRRAGEAQPGDLAMLVANAPDVPPIGATSRTRPRRVSADRAGQDRAPPCFSAA